MESVSLSLSRSPHRVVPRAKRLYRLRSDEGVDGRIQALSAGVAHAQEERFAPVGKKVGGSTPPVRECVGSRKEWPLCSVITKEIERMKFRVKQWQARRKANRRRRQ